MSDEETKSFLDFGDEDYSEIPDLSSVPDGQYTLRLLALSTEVSQKGKPYILGVCAVEGQPNAKNVRVLNMLPDPDTDERQQANRKRAIKYFFQAFGIPTSGRIDFDSYLDRTAEAMLREKDDPEYGSYNDVARWL